MTTPKRTHMKEPCSQTGFTLIELMVVVAIIAILAMVAYPAYTEQVKDGRRSECKGQIMALAASLENHRARHFSYDGATVANLAPSLSNSDYYTAQITLSNNNQSYVITATPKGGMSGDGTLRLNSEGQSCWVEGAATCALSATSSWTQ